MATVAFLTERVRKIGLSLASAARKGDDHAVAKWAHMLADAATSLAVAVDPPAVELLKAVAPVERAVALTYDAEMALFLDAQDVILQAKGRPFGREGALRGAITLGEAIEICERLDLPLMLAEFRGMFVPGAAQ